MSKAQESGQESGQEEAGPDGAAESRDVPRTRPCLRCGADFPSQWFGERICPRCKGTAAWRNGSALRPQSRGGSR